MSSDPNVAAKGNNSIETICEKEAEAKSGGIRAPSENKESHLKNLNSDVMIKWLSTTIGLITAGVGTTSLLYDKFVLPYTNPIKITLEADVKEIKNTDSEIKGERQVLLNATAKNVTQRKISLNKSFWVIYGHMENENSTRSADSDESLFYVSKKNRAELTKALNIDASQAGRVRIKYDDRGTSHLPFQHKHFLGMGPLFTVLSLLPQAEIKAKRVIIIPKEATTRYLEVAINIPITTDSSTTSKLIKWGGCIVNNISEPCLSSVQAEGTEGPYQWKSSFCEDFPINTILKLDTLLSVYKLEGNRFKDNDKYCSKYVGGLSAEEASRLGAGVHVVNYEIPLDQS
jgi:hypothetical protein